MHDRDIKKYKTKNLNKRGKSTLMYFWYGVILFITLSLIPKLFFTLLFWLTKHTIIRPHIYQITIGVSGDFLYIPVLFLLFGYTKSKAIELLKLNKNLFELTYNKTRNIQLKSTVLKSIRKEYKSALYIIELSKKRLYNIIIGIIVFLLTIFILLLTKCYTHQIYIYQRNYGDLGAFYIYYINFVLIPFSWGFVIIYACSMALLIYADFRMLTFKNLLLKHKIYEIPLFKPIKLYYKEESDLFTTIFYSIAFLTFIFAIYMIFWIEVSFFTNSLIKNIVTIISLGVIISLFIVAIKFYTYTRVFMEEEKYRRIKVLEKELEEAINRKEYNILFVLSQLYKETLNESTSIFSLPSWIKMILYVIAYIIYYSMMPIISLYVNKILFH